MAIHRASGRGHASRSSAELPISIRFPPELRRRTERFAARSHLGLATAIRTIVGEYLDEIDASEDLTRAEEWQRAQSWATAQDLTRKKVPETTLEELRRDQATALARVARRRGHRG
jgi:predicted DNA-binding protein